ncbi:dTDP-4-amino-4,6-dideoxygalactose transaminase [Idiomarina loihiensis]|jgi:dTDP-4-amino-4,6-dideoxygalactose transaminase|uniref:DegT/DnrJ/EryC1/StrS family aminotransferase n=1 Tax=Idiomarina TaxID=135575 RepID=UPI000D71156D|nr:MULTISPECIES: DegT/DnrJ/EryC1/StrS family aminotransferase [Idiomarina]PWW37685.1 dTDP-4-amino-4,6-dideoxygalactose transaminase [Idiomarina loihiensis]TDP47408.1 dTDP-4-amino-4,6-dideoxygalactose transaminase [Idiomarina loihiensis]TDS23149.1 dTDP-4-amino-4,6-dideoxygalactose transaminase [Idiomarina sp. H2]
MNHKPIYVTQPYLPPLKEFIPYLEEIWQSKVLTNSGPMHQKLEKELEKYLGVNHIVLFNNGTNALLSALQALDLKGEVITTPYSFVATTNSIVWNNLTPVFVDIEPRTLNLDPAKIEAAITSKTTAIMPVHCYGNRCEVNAIQAIADRYNLKVLYDAAHAFGVQDEGGSILRYGDLSVISFHATKVFNTFEGGAVVCHSAETKERLSQLKNFGIIDEVTINEVGINGKMSEINAAFGLLQLKYIDKALKERYEIDRFYRENLSDVTGIHIIDSNVEIARNYSYFPILVTDKYSLSRDALYEKLKQHNIFSRRYFYPLISDFRVYTDLNSVEGKNLPVGKDAAQRVLCLPIYAGFDEQVSRVVEIIRDL